ncbi:MAG: DUF401 family protein, partial [Clostridiales bacterium]|nr:DUF401 family protein [Clostridiales bacterium]
MWYLRKLPKERPAISNSGQGKLLTALLASLWPLLILIVLMLALDIKVYIATALILTSLIIVEHIPIRQLPRLFWESTNLRLLLTVILVIAFKDMLMLCGVMDILPAAIASLPIPAFLIFSLMALLISAITGMTLASVGIALPLALAGVSDPLPITVLILLSAYCGVQITPMHLCITMAAEYLHADLRRVLLKSLPPYLFIYTLSICLYLLLSNRMWL